jgi:peroxiredoxin
MENRIRPHFLPLLITYSVLVTGVASVAVLTGGPTAVWIPVAVAAAQVWLFFLRLHVAQVPRTTPGLLGITLGIFAATMYALYQGRNGGAGSVGPLLAFVSLGGWVGYVMWFSDLDRTTDRIKVGRRLPPLHLTDTAGATVILPLTDGGRNLIVFFRGNWCPICVAQLLELAGNSVAFTRRGVRVFAISPQPPARNVQMEARLNGKVTLLHDADNAVSAQLGLVQAGAVPSVYVPLGYLPDAPKPTVVVTDAKGQVVWCDQPENYRLRPRVEDILAELDRR